MYPGIWQILLVVVVLVLLFGRGKISDLMSDVAKGIKSFKKGMSEDEQSTASVKSLEHGASEMADMSKAGSAEKNEAR